MYLVDLDLVGLDGRAYVQLNLQVPFALPRCEPGENGMGHCPIAELWEVNHVIMSGSLDPVV